MVHPPGSLTLASFPVPVLGNEATLTHADNCNVNNEHSVAIVTVLYGTWSVMVALHHV